MENRQTVSLFCFTFAVPPSRGASCREEVDRSEKGATVKGAQRRLRTLALGISVAAIATQMKRSTAAVRDRAARLKIVVAKSRLKAKRK